MQNATPLRDLTVRVANTDLSYAGQTGVAIDNRYAGVTLNAAIDLGGGALGSPGGNCLFGSKRYDAETTSYQVIARNNWWGHAAGPRPAKISASPPLLAGLDVTPVGGAAPAACK